MSKPKMYGMKTSYIPNAEADMRNRKKVYQKPPDGRRSRQGRPSANRLPGGGNAVCPPMAKAMVQANFPEYCKDVKITTLAQFHSAVAL